MVKLKKKNGLDIVSVAFFVFLILALLALSGCGETNEKASPGNNAAHNAVQDNSNSQPGNAAEGKNKEGQELVNFKCVWKNGALKGETIYVLKDKIKIINTEGKEVWLDRDYAYMVNEGKEKKYLIKMPASDSGFSYEDMIGTYKGSKLKKGMDRELGVVSESDIKKPDYEIITMEELINKKMEELGSQLGK